MTTGDEPMNTDQATSKVDCILVLGMHRSGSSLLAGCLHLLGAELGENLMRPTEHNPDGHWENHDLVVLHDILLRDLGCRWDMIGGLPDGWLESPAADRAREQIRGVLETSFPARGLWSIKDPRMCRLLPLWKPVLEEMGVHPGFVLILRHPWEVAQSLARRDGFDLLKGHLLWLIHNREALEACQDQPHVVTTYDRLLADPVSTLSKIGDELGVEYPHSLRRQYGRVLDFVRLDLKHQHAGQPDHEQERNRFRHFAWLYDQFRAREAGRRTRLAAGEKDEGAAGQGDGAEDRRGFPLHPLARVAPEGPDSLARRDASLEHGEGVFRDFLSLIGGFERSLRDHDLEKERKILSSTRTGTLMFAQLFFPAPGEERYAEERSASFLLPQNEWQQIRAPLPDPGVLRTVPLRFDPLNTNGMVLVSSVQLVHAARGSVCWRAEEPADFDAFQVAGEAFRLPSEEGLLLMVFGHDPWIFLPPLPDLPDGPMEVRIWIKAGSNQKGLEEVWNRREQAEAGLREALDEAVKAREALQAETAGLEQRRIELVRELEGARIRAAEAESRAGKLEETLQAERALVARSIEMHREERDRHEAEAERLAAENRQLELRLVDLEGRNDGLRRQRDRLEERCKALEEREQVPRPQRREESRRSGPSADGLPAAPSGADGASPPSTLDRLAESLRDFCGRIEAKEADLDRHEDRLRAFAGETMAPPPDSGRPHE